MYPYELEALIQKNDGMLGGKDLLRAISPEENNLSKVKFVPSENKYYLEDRTGNHYEFTAIPNKDTVRKGKTLVKK